MIKFEHYFPFNFNAMQYQKLNNINFFDDNNFQMLMARLNKIQPNAARIWGKMTVVQMLHHLNLAIGSGLGFYQLPNTSTWVSRTIVKWTVLKILKRLPINIFTAKPLQVAASNLNFEEEKKQLIAVLSKAYSTTSDADWGAHTYFGEMNRKDWGNLIMIHCNHHFQQFSN
jgi:hypothetical protein